VDEQVRIVILTGEQDGEFLMPPAKSDYVRGVQDARLADPASEWGRFTGCIRVVLGGRGLLEGFRVLADVGRAPWRARTCTR
jgi:hypothetical protein